MTFSILEIIAVLLTIITGIASIVLFLIKRKERSYEVSLLDNIYTTAYRAIQELDEGIQACRKDDRETNYRYITDAKATINAVREMCQHRTQLIMGRNPYRDKPWSHSTREMSNNKTTTED